MSTDGQRVAKARISDEELRSALEEATSDATMADVVRSALRSELLEDDESGEEGALSPRAREGLQVLRREIGTGRSAEYDVVRSVVSNHLGIKKAVVRGVVLDPLRRENLISVNQGVQQSYITIHGGGSE